MDSLINPKTIGDALEKFAEQEHILKKPKLVSNAKTCIKLYGDNGLQQPLDNIKRIKETIETNLAIAATAGKNSGTLRNYKNCFEKFYKWLGTQSLFDCGLIENKYCPPMFFGQYKKKISTKEPKLNYGIKTDEIPTPIKDEIEKFKKFKTAKEVAARKGSAVRTVTMDKHLKIINQFLGFLQNIDKQKLTSLSQLCDLDNLSALTEYLINERSCCYRTVQFYYTTSIEIAKFLYGKKAKADYRDIEIISDLREKSIEINKKAKSEPSRKNTIEHIVEFPILLKICRYLKQCTAEKLKDGNKRYSNAIYHSWCEYLMLLILTYRAPRQRELRELELGRTLIKKDGIYWIKLSPDDHKTGSKTGKGREFKLPPFISSELDYFLENIRPTIDTPDYPNILFLGQKTRCPLTVQKVTSMISLTTRRALLSMGIDKWIRPHDFRNIAITHHRKHGNRNQDEGLAEIMGHSKEMADKTYSMMTSAEITEKAENWWEVSQ